MRKNGRFFNFQRHFQEKTFEKKQGTKWGQKGDTVGIFFGILSLKKFGERAGETDLQSLSPFRISLQGNSIIKLNYSRKYSEGLIKRTAAL